MKSAKAAWDGFFKAEQMSLRREVAIKVILFDGNAAANHRFLLEASLTANLDHPNIVKIFDFGRTDDGMLFLVMELPDRAQSGGLGEQRRPSQRSGRPPDHRAIVRCALRSPLAEYHSPRHQAVEHHHRSTTWGWHDIQADRFSGW